MTAVDHFRENVVKNNCRWTGVIIDAAEHWECRIVRALLPER